jgi:5-formyltetrahydrofolate cyclo-ligase
MTSPAEPIDPALVRWRKAERKRLIAERLEMSSEARTAAGAAIGAALAERFPPGSMALVAGYWPIRGELDCQSILIRLMDSFQPVCLPVVLGDTEPLSLRLWEHGAPLYEAGFGTLAPSELAPAVEPDVILVPLLGFDKRGTRLGYGGGYYDRTLDRLKKKPRLVGIAFAVQEIDEIPREAHDVPLDMIVTENGAQSFAPASA